MAQLIYEKQSSTVHLNATHRHSRLCRQIKGGEQYATRIEPYYNELLEKQKISEKAKLDKETAYDDVILNDSDLDNSIRTLFERCKQYDRENPGRPILNELFRDGKISSIIYAPLVSGPDMVDQLLTRIAALDAGNPIHELSASIKKNIDKCKNAISIYHNFINAQKMAEAVEEIAKSNLRRQYEYNYLDIAKEFGKIYANRLFPIINSSSKTISNREKIIETPEVLPEIPE
jgi:hypothetical protein